MQTIVDVLLCPDCGSQVLHTVSYNGFRAASTSIGPPRVPCPSCSVPVSTGLKEWDEHHFLEKVRFVLSRLFWLMVGSVVVAGAGAMVLKLFALEFVWIDERDGDPFFWVCFSIGAVIITAMVLRNSLREVNESRSRISPS